jgi:hypothetical protein
MPECFPNARDCELLAHAPENVRFTELCPFIPDPLWFKFRWFEDQPRNGRSVGRAFRRLALAAFAARAGN